MKIGNKQDAELIYRRRRTGSGPLPKGWRKLGSGAFRTSYLSPDRVVYKVCHDEESDKWNEYEFNNYIHLRKTKARLPKGWAIAPVKLYTITHEDKLINIVAMKFIEGWHQKDIDDEDWDDWLHKVGASQAFRACNMWDAHEENFLFTPSGKKVIIDLGERSDAKAHV